MDQRLRDAEERFRLIAEMTSDYAYSFAVDDQGQMHVEWLTDSVVRDLGYTAEELDGMGGPIQMVHPDDYSKAAAVLGQLLQGGTIPALELRLVAKDGSVRWVRFHVRTIFDAEHRRLRRILGAAQDISVERAAAEQRERMDTRLRQAERLETVGQMAGGVAHDFNNVLAIISNYSEFVQAGVSDVASGAAAPETLQAVLEDVQQIRRAVDRAADLTKRLLLFSRRSVVKPAVLDLNALLRDLEPVLRRTLRPSIEVVCRYADALWTVEADPSQMEQVVLNLALNSQDAMPDGGMLHIATANVLLSGKAPQLNIAPGAYVSLTVADSGTGMSREAQEHAFEPFFTTKPHGTGTGLGLATVHGVVTQAGGGINIYSESGVGTTIRTYLPRAAKTAAPADDSRTEEVEEGHGETVLLVEDEELVRESTARMLSAAGYTVLSAATMEEALPHAQAGLAALITDVMLAGRSGKEVAHEVSRRVPGVKVMYVSGYPQQILSRRGIIEPGTVLLEKPVPEADLLRVLRTQLDQK